MRPRQDEPGGARRAGVHLATFVVALTVFLIGITRPYTWTDEGVTYITVHRTWGQLVTLWHGSDAPLLPYYLVTKAWLDVWGWIGGPGVTLLRIRALSAVAAALTAVVVQAFVMRRRGLLAGVLVAAAFIVMPGASRYAQEARPYALLMLATSSCWWAFDRWCALRPVRRGSGSPRSASLVPAAEEARRWSGRALAFGALLTVCLMAAVLLSPFGGLTWCALAVWSGLQLLGRPDEQAGSQSAADRPNRGWASARSWANSWLGSLLPMVVAGLVVAVPVVHIVQHGRGPVAVFGSAPRTLARMAVQAVLVSYVPPWFALVTVVLVVTCLANLVQTHWTRRAQTRRVQPVGTVPAAPENHADQSPADRSSQDRPHEDQEASGLVVATLTWLLVTGILTCLIGVAKPALLRPRYWTPLIPPVAILAGVGAEVIVRRVAARIPGAGALVRGCLAALTVAVLALASWPQQAAVRAPSGHSANLSPVLAAVRQAQSSHPGARILITSDAGSFYFAEPAPDLYRENILSTPDPDRAQVWNVRVPAAERQAILREAPSLIWIVWRPGSTPRRADVEAEIAAAGLHRESQRAIDHMWYVRAYGR